MKTKKKSVAYRFHPQAVRMIAQLARKMGKSKTSIVEDAIYLIHRLNNVE